MTTRPYEEERLQITELNRGEEVKIYLASGAIIEGTTADDPVPFDPSWRIEIMTDEGLAFIWLDAIVAYILIGSWREYDWERMQADRRPIKSD
jgi:hypothetical protein